MFQNWDEPLPAFQSMMCTQTLKCGDSKVGVMFDGSFMTLRWDNMMFYKPTLYGKRMTRVDYSKLFYFYNISEYLEFRMVESIERTETGVVLTLHASVRDHDVDLPLNEKLQVVMEQLDVEYTQEGRINYVLANTRANAELQPCDNYDLFHQRRLERDRALRMQMRKMDRPEASQGGEPSVAPVVTGKRQRTGEVNAACAGSEVVVKSEPAEVMVKSEPAEVLVKSEPENA